MFETNPRLLHGRHEIEFANGQQELASTADDDISNVDGLMLGVGGSGDVGEIKDFFNGGETDVMILPGW